MILLSSLVCLRWPHVKSKLPGSQVQKVKLRALGLDSAIQLFRSSLGKEHEKCPKNFWTAQIGVKSKVKMSKSRDLREKWYLFTFKMLQLVIFQGMDLKCCTHICLKVLFSHTVHFRNSKVAFSAKCFVSSYAIFWTSKKKRYNRIKLLLSINLYSW